MKLILVPVMDGWLCMPVDPLREAGMSLERASEARGKIPSWAITCWAPVKHVSACERFTSQCYKYIHPRPCVFFLGLTTDHRIVATRKHRKSQQGYSTNTVHHGLHQQPP